MSAVTLRFRLVDGRYIPRNPLAECLTDLTQYKRLYQDDIDALSYHFKIELVD